MATKGWGKTSSRNKNSVSQRLKKYYMCLKN